MLGRHLGAVLELCSDQAHIQLAKLFLSLSISLYLYIAIPMFLCLFRLSLCLSLPVCLSPYPRGPSSNSALSRQGKSASQHIFFCISMYISFLCFSLSDIYMTSIAQLIKASKYVCTDRSPASAVFMNEQIISPIPPYLILFLYFFFSLAN